MRYVCQYNSQEERQEIITANLDKTLIEEQNLTEGNFLVFTDESITPKPIPEPFIGQRIADLEAAVAAMMGGAV